MGVGQFKNVGKSAELVSQIEEQGKLEEELAAINSAAIEPDELMSIVTVRTTEISTQISKGDICNLNFGANLSSLADLMMNAFINIDFEFPDFDIDFDLSLGFDLDLNSLFNGLSLSGIFDFPNIFGCDTLLPDIGPGAAKIVKDAENKVLVGREGESSGGANPLKTLGNQFIKHGFDADGNPINILVTKGNPAIIAQTAGRTQAKPATLGTFEPPGYAVGGLQDNTPKPPVYGADEETLAKIKGEVDDPIFTEKIKQGMFGTATPDTTKLTLEEQIASRNTQRIATNVSTGLGTTTSV